MANEQLRNMLNNLINEKSAEATLDFHQYITEQVKSIVGLSEGEKNDVLKKLLDPKINWWEQIDDVKKAFKSKEISDDDVETWSKKIDNDKNVSSFGKFGAGVYLIPSKSEYFVDSRDGDSISNYLYLHITGGGTLISANGSDFDELEDFAKKNGPKGLSIIYAYNGGSSAVGEIAIIGCKPSEIKVLSKELSQHYTANDFDEDIANEEDGEVDNATTFASHYFGGLEKFMKDYGVSKKDALSFLDIEAPNVVSVLETSKGILMAIAEND